MSVFHPKLISRKVDVPLERSKDSPGRTQIADGCTAAYRIMLLHILHNLGIHLAYDDEIHFSALGSFAARRHEALALDE